MAALFSHDIAAVQMFVVCYLHSGILMDVRRDNRVLSLVNRAGLKGTLSQMLDQLQRCQKSLNEFLEVSNKFCFTFSFDFRTV